MALIQPEKAVLAYLEGVTALAAVLDDKIYWPRVPDGKRGDRRLVVFRKTEGGPEPEIDCPAKRPTLEFWCYGATGDQANQVARELVAALDAISHNTAAGHLIQWAVPVDNGEDAIDGDGEAPGWPVVSVKYQVSVLLANS